MTFQIRLFSRWQDAPWDQHRWPNFTPSELACRCPIDSPHYCRGEFYYDPEFFDGLQVVRNRLGEPLRLNSAHRCALRNAYVGGAALSQHKLMAADLALDDHNPRELLDACKLGGFTTFGFYRTFLHIDQRIKPDGSGRRWFSSPEARKQWTQFLT
jgi:zinc D-Ala-D-Ala carboxypeptidase